MEIIIYLLAKSVVNVMPDVCTECGAPLRKRARFCHVCGAPVVAQKRSEPGKPGKLVCDRCGKSIPEGAKFCGACGNPTSRFSKESTIELPPVAETTRPSAEPGLHEIPILSEVSIPMSSDISEERPATPEIEVPEEMVMILYARKRAPEIQKELDAQEEELDALSEKMNVGLLTKKEAMEQLGTLKTAIKELKNEKAQLGEAASVPLEIEQLDKELNTIKEWEEKLEGLKKSGNVSDTVYQKVTREYEEKRRNLEDQLREQVLRLKQWTALLQKKAEKLAREQETLKVRLQVEGISSEDAETTLKAIKTDYEKAKVAEEQSRMLLKKFL
ncbi:MAG: zinc-ribbon domain-containing protein [Promethearchaeota archaeon]